MKPSKVGSFYRADSKSKKKKKASVSIYVRFNNQNRFYTTGLDLNVEEYKNSQKRNPEGDAQLHALQINVAQARMKAIVDLLDPYIPDVFAYITKAAKTEYSDIFIDTKFEFDAHEIASKFVEEYNRTNPGAEVCSVKEKDANGNYSMVPAVLNRYAGEVQANFLPVEKIQTIAAQAQEIVGKNGEKITIMNGENSFPGGPTQTQILIHNTFNINTNGGDSRGLLENSCHNPDSDLLKWMMSSMKKSNEASTVAAYLSAQTKLIQFLVLSERLKLEELEQGTKEPYIQIKKSKKKTLINKIPKYKPPHISFRALNRDIIDEFEAWMQTNGKGRGRGMSSGTVKTYLSYFKSAYQLAVKEGILKNKENPFDGFVMPEPGERDLCLTEEQLKAILEYEPEDAPIYQTGKKAKGRKRHFSERIGRGYWLFSLLSYGMNVMDIALLKEKKLLEEYFGFKRSKTQKKVKSAQDIEVPLHEYHIEFIKEFANKNRGLEDYVFPIMETEIPPKPLIEMTLLERNQWEKGEMNRNKRRVNTFVTQVNRYMRKIAVNLGFDPKIFTTYSARHTFANRARAIMENYEIAKLLGHKSGIVPNARVAEKFYLNSKEKNKGKQVNNQFAELMPKKPNNEEKEAAA